MAYRDLPALVARAEELETERVRALGRDRRARTLRYLGWLAQDTVIIFASLVALAMFVIILRA